MSTPADSSTAQPITFHQNSPRPPVVPGEETCVGLNSPLTQWGGKLCRGGSPIPMPRRSTLTHHETLPEGCAPLGFEPEGSSSPSGLSASPPACLRWARCLPALLEDPDGVDLFRRYLEAEGRAHADALDFWFACEGLRKQTDPDKIGQLVRVIHRRYFLKTQLGVSEELRRTVNRRIKEGSADCVVFTEAQQEVERIITDTTYPNFLRSDIYLGHVQAMQNGSSGSSSGSGSRSGSGSGSGSGREGEATADLVGMGGSCMLATVHEDAELTEEPASPSALPLTRDMLLVTQKRRATELRPKPEAYAGVFLQAHVSKARLAYSSYNPVSRQDSELQSLSSDARTESDNMSLTDSSLDGRSNSGHHKHSRKQYQRHCRQMKEAANLNRDSYMHHTVIPRTQRIQKEQIHQMKPNDFAAILIEKLESVKRNQETQEMLDRKLSEADVFPPQDFTAAVQRSLTETIREKLQLEDDNDQDILDQHVSRVWSDLTPSRSPGLASPRPKSPPHRRAVPPISKVGNSGSSLPSMGLSHPYQTRPYPYRRKDKDVFSTFSSDSGNVHDFPEGSEHRHHLPKSKSMPDYADGYPQVPGNESRLRQCRNKWSSKKTELTDSGVSVVSDTPPASLACAAQTQFKDSRVLSWLLESGPGTGAASAHSERGSVSSCGKHSHRRRSASPPAPAQPFVADPSMPPLPSPHTATQLEEARRRLMEDERTKQSRPRVCNTRAELMSQSVGSTMRRGAGGGKSQAGNGGGSYTTVVFSFCDEQFPYRTKIPGPQVTLRQFKEYLPKKGSYRYFFKTECEDLDMKVIQEEITDDNDILPLWEGKVMAQVKSAE